MRTDEQQKAIVKAIMKDRGKRDKRRQKGEQTRFDMLAAEAVLTACRELDTPGMDEGTRDIVIGKICESLEKTLPWEVLGETFMGRRQFYQLRGKFIALVARNMGMTDPERKRVTKKDLKQYIAQVKELDILADQIGRMEDGGECAERRKALRESVRQATAEVESYVASIRDSEVRQIIMLRYMDPKGRMTWQRVANAMNRGGGRYTADYCRIKLDRFLG